MCHTTTDTVTTAVVIEAFDRLLEQKSPQAFGNTHQDIGDILGLNPRTVNQHLEHVYVKLGVETRTAATSVTLAAI